MSENETKEQNPLDAQFGDWMKDFAKKEGSSGGGASRNKIEWIKFDKPGKYPVRLIGKYVEYLKHYKPFPFGTRLISHPSYKGKDPAWAAGFYPGTSYAIHIIDRADGKLKILDKGRKLFECFFDYGTANGIDPAGKDAPNFVIKVEWPNGNKKLAKYSAVAAGGACPLTAEEITTVKAGRANLGQIYRATPLEKILEAWEAVPEQYRTPKKDGENAPEAPAKATKTASAPAAAVETAAPAVPEESMQGAPAEEDDLFGEGKDAQKTDW